MSPQALLILTPVVLAWIAILSDIVLQPRMSAVTKASWALACTVFWPMLVVYWLTRPMQGRAERPVAPWDQRSRLVDAALGHEEGRLDDEQMARVVRALRQGQME